MGIFENVLNLCKKNKLPISHLEKDLSFSNGSIRRWNESSPSADKIQKVAEYFKVSTDYLIYGFHRGWLASGLKLIRGERPFSQFVKDMGVDEDELHELCAGTATKQPSLETIEKIIAGNPFQIPPRDEIIEAAGYDPEEVTAYPKLHVRIKELREKDKLTIEELSERAEIAPATLRLYESGAMNNNPDPFVLAQITDAFFIDCTPDYVLGLATKSYRDRYKSIFRDDDNKHMKLLEEIESYINKIDLNKYSNQRHRKMMDEIENYEAQKSSLPALSPQDEREIAKDLEIMLNSLDHKSGMAAYNDPEDQEDQELLKASLQTSMRLAKQIAKKKYTPKKYRKE